MILGPIRVWQRNLKVWTKHYQASLIGNLGQPILFLIAMGVGLKKEVPEINGLTYLQFIAPGLVASAIMYGAALETTYNSYTRLTIQRSYEAVLMTPISAKELALGEILWGATKGLLAGVIMLAALPLFGVIPSIWTIALIPILFFEGIFFAALGLIMTAIASNYDFFNYFTSLVITPLFLFSGIFFPIDEMSKFIRPILYSLPLTHVVLAARQLCYGRITPMIFIYASVTITLAIFTSILASNMLKKRLIK